MTPLRFATLITNPADIPSYLALLDLAINDSSDHLRSLYLHTRDMLAAALEGAPEDRNLEQGGEVVLAIVTGIPRHEAIELGERLLRVESARPDVAHGLDLVLHALGRQVLEACMWLDEDSVHLEKFIGEMYE